MKKSWLLLTLMFSSVAPVYAQSSVTLYGIIDTGVEYVSHANAAGDGVFRMPAITGSLPSRWGLRGVEDLGGGLKALFTLENGFNVRGGDIGQGGRLFGRQAWVGLSSNYGNLTFGRQYTMTYIALLENEIMGPAIYSLGSLDAYVPSARSDNSIVYKGTFSGLTVGLTYSFGRDSAGTGNSPGQGTCAGPVAGDFQQCKQWSAMLKYDTSHFGAVVSYDQQRGGTNAAANFFDGVATTTIPSSGDRDTRIQANAYVNYFGAKVSGGWLGRWVEPGNPAVASVRSDIYYLGAQYFVTPAFIVDGAVYRVINAEHDTRATLGTVRTTYLLSKATAVYAQVGYLGNSAHARYSVSSGGPGATPAAGSNQTAAMLGVKHLF
ncbi:porin [Burkholderia cepacia]|uniref:Porin n=1 Tax=Burkholderia cepacia TaxID=292 RepID=A0A8I1DRW7_BURCE|nr:porin [Burkholderia cepacia]MBA9902053.1 porin [Burkholderia cepacia]MBA9943333.1 porin [Burkholderia cepacia]MBA9979273.1 porin [Burkholderia cepacia]MBA9998058.1 porin [Burkholderia cepacia]MBA9999798.1 porin [Burkholderia cepacia]